MPFTSPTHVYFECYNMQHMPYVHAGKVIYTSLDQSPKWTSRLFVPPCTPSVGNCNLIYSAQPFNCFSSCAEDAHSVTWLLELNSHPCLYLDLGLATVPAHTDC